MSKEATVSEMDKLNLELIRANVKKLIATTAERFDKPGLKILDIAPQDYAGAKEFFTSAITSTLDIDPASDADFIADLCKTNKSIIPDESFDIILCTEVLEHTLNPFAAVDEIERMLIRGGVAIISTPLNFRIHGPLPDCWRFTEHGLKQLFRKFATVELGSLETENRELFPIHYTLIALKK